jgi:hypothetical protein
MATNPSIDPDLLARALAVSGERTKKAAVTQALQEFIARWQQKRLLELMGKLEWDEGFDYKGRALASLSLFVDTASGRWLSGATHPFHRTSDASWSARSKPAGTCNNGPVLQELLQGFSRPRHRAQILDRFTALPLLVPGRRDHVNAAELKNKCRRAGIQIGTRCAAGATLLPARPDDAHRRRRLSRYRKALRP